MAAVYFAESITTKNGFYGIPCPSYFNYFFGFCSHVEKHTNLNEENKQNEDGVPFNEDNNNVSNDNNQILMGEYCPST